MKTLKEIFLDNKWCANIEPTKTAGKILYIMTLSDLDTGQAWHDENLPPLFSIHLPKNAHFVPDPDHPIAKCKELNRNTPTLEAYVDSLKSTIPPTALAPKTTMTKYAKPPPNRSTPTVLISYK